MQGSGVGAGGAGGPGGDPGAEEMELSPCAQWVLRQVQQTFKHLSFDKLELFCKAEPTLREVTCFVDDPDTMSLYFREKKGGHLELLDSVPSNLGGAGAGANQAAIFYMVKVDHCALTEDNILDKVVYGDVQRDPLAHLAHLAEAVFMPVIRNKHNRDQWSDLIAKEVLEGFNNFVANIQITEGHVRGTTYLPLPFTDDDEEAGEDSDGGKDSAGDAAHTDEPGSSRRHDPAYDEDDDGAHEENKSLLSGGGATGTDEGKGGDPGADGGLDTARQQQIHVLEGAVITWTKQIKSILKQDPEMLLKEGNHPGPIAELDFWEHKASNLNGVFDQLQSARVRKVLRALDQCKSTYNAPFARLCKDVFQARFEANNNAKFLNPLRSWFDLLEGEPRFDNLHVHFQPILHLVLLVWKSSAFYNTAARLVVLMREICNTLIRKATEYLNGDMIFELIEREETKEAVEMLRCTLKIFGRFKSTYFDYKAKANVECPENAWKIQNNAIFVRLDAFLERCHDILEFAQTIMQFSKLAKIEVGGTKGKTLTTSVAQIYSDFVGAVEGVRTIGSRILALDVKEFEDAFYDFRSKVKELDRRLGSVIVQGFDDCSTVTGRFKLLDSFDSLVTRPIIADELEKKHPDLISAIAEDLQLVQQMFLELKNAPTVAHNLPPIAGALTWCRGLLQRVQVPMDKLKSFDRKVLDREDAREVVKSYTTLLAQLAEFEREKIEDWGHSIETSSQAKLKNPLLRKDQEAPDAPILLYVNFDPLLVRLLREVKYFLLLGLTVPDTALEIYEKGEVFRRHMGNLDLIVNMYNTIQTSVLPVERPLLRAQLASIDHTLAQGVGDNDPSELHGGVGQSADEGDGADAGEDTRSVTGALTPVPGSGPGGSKAGRGGHKSKKLNWKSTGIDLFVTEAMTEVRDVSETLSVMKTNLNRVHALMEIWGQSPVFERMSKTSAMQEFLDLQSTVCNQRYELVREGGQEIHHLLKDSNKKLKVSQGLPHWKAYVDYVNNILVGGMTEMMRRSLEVTERSLNPEIIIKQNMSPLVEIDLDLIAGDVYFVPEVGFISAEEVAMRSPALPQRGLKNVVEQLIDGMLGIANTFKRLDAGEGNYLRELTEDPPSQNLIQQINRHLDGTEVKANHLRETFRKYSYLWTTDLGDMFNEFVKHAVTREYVLHATADQDGASAGSGGGGEESKAADEAQGNNAKANTSGTNAAAGGSGGGAAAEGGDTGADAMEPGTYWVRESLNLDKFDERVRNFLAVQNEVTDLKSVHEIDFVRVNVQPIKQAIGTWVTKWIFQFTFYLQDHVGNSLREVHEFMSRVTAGLDQEVTAGDKERLMEVMTHIRDVKKRMPELEGLFGPLRDIVVLLKTHGIAIDVDPVGDQPALEFLEGAPMTWDNTVNKTFRVKEEIQPLQNAMVDSIRKDVTNFKSRVSKFVGDFHINGPLAWPDARVVEAYRSLDRYQTELIKVEAEAQSYAELEELFELSVSRYAALVDMRSELSDLKRVWDQVALVRSLFDQWNATLWAEINTEDLLDATKALQLQIKQLPRRTKDWAVYKDLSVRVKNIAVVLPLVHDLRQPAMRERHWKALAKVTGNVVEKGPTFCLADLLALQLHRHVDGVLEVVEVAAKEMKVETKLIKIERHWAENDLEFVQHRDSEVYVVSPPEEVLEALEEHQLQLQGMIGMGKSVDFFRERMETWQSSLGNVETTLKLLLSVQKEWGSLEAIFLGSRDIRSQLPEDTKRFEAADNDFKELMRDMQGKTKVVDSCTEEGREAQLRHMHAELDKCQRALNEYLDMKKNIFPRFYFVSNSALLDILSNGNNPPRIMPHVGSVFDGIGKLDLVESPGEKGASHANTATSMIAKDGETVRFLHRFHIEGPVELWLGDLVSFMQNTLKQILNNAITDAQGWDVDRPREDWVSLFPAQISLLGSQIMWTEESEAALEEYEGGTEDAVKRYRDTCSARLEALIRLVQGDLSKDARVKAITVITIDVHNRDVVAAIVAQRVESAQDFKWQSQLRYYWDQDEQDVKIRICDFRTQYSFEYVGNCGRLVITPLTDRCYVTLTTALRLMLGGAPAGPAGTGKTETTKDLARGLGLPCYVFNCSDQMNYRTMGDIFKGLTQVGAWGCFDEFNRINIEVLSVVAAQVKTVLDAIVRFAIPENRAPEFQTLPAGTPPNKVGEFDFFGETISLVPTCGMFITMNPGYAGRTELPENLKALFRSCAMIRPDLEPICENMLMAEGFVKARPLAVKFVTLYKLSSELLSKQHHYDWGLRAVKSVLRVAGMLKRSDPAIDEEAILMRALRDFNTPKIPQADTPIFLRLISDLFPNMDLLPKVNEDLKTICTSVCQETGIQHDEMFVLKVTQFEEILAVRHSVMLLGPGGSGKTTVWKTLAACHNRGLAKPTTVYETINPKSVTSDELYGYMTLAKDWKDGVLSIVMRNMSKEWTPYSNHQTAKWVVLDGDIDAVWIESMNTVMDDNKVLTLVSNERIPLSDSMRMVFEIHSLKNATPATVSRAGILYINATDVGYVPVIESWAQHRENATEKGILTGLLAKYIPHVVELVSGEKLSETQVPLSTLNKIQTMLHILEGLLDSAPYNKTGARGGGGGGADNSDGAGSAAAGGSSRGLNTMGSTIGAAPVSGQPNPEIIEKLFFFAAMWAFGGAMADDKNVDYRREFSMAFRSAFKSTALKIPETGTVFDYYVDVRTGEVNMWEDAVPEFTSSVADMAFSNIVVPTVDSVRLTYLMDLLVKRRRPVMLVGAAGTGKTTIAKDYLRSMDESMMFVTINMNFYTDSASLQAQLEGPIDKRSGRTYGPPSSKRLVYFIDDLNMPFVETYGTQTPIALLRQHVDYEAWFDRTDLGLKKVIHDVQYVACMNHKSGSFFVNPRLQRHFATFSALMPSSSDLNTIYGSILDSHLSGFGEKIQRVGLQLIDATLGVHKEMCQRFLPSAVKFHYNFNMREIAAVVQGLLQSRPEYYSSTLQMSRLWVHECMRTFSDRLISDTEIHRCRDLIVDVAKRFLDDDAEEIFEEPVVFTQFTTQTPDEIPTYLPISDIPQLKKVLAEKQAEYNETNAIMNLVLFEQAMLHVTRITRILSVPRGNALLVGLGGSGKQSLSRLASFICGYDVNQIAVSSDYGVTELKEDLKDVYRRAGVKPAEPLVFMLSDSQIVDERFLVYINDVLSSGVIPDLFAHDEYDQIFNSLRPIGKALGISDNRDSMMELFTDRVRSNLHVVLCFSPAGDAFRTRARRFPGIINCTSIDWFHPWPKEGLVSVAQRFLEDVEMGAEVKENISYHVAEVHMSVNRMSDEFRAKERRHNYTTPKSFLELISFYKTLLADKRSEMQKSIHRLETGLATLRKTNDDVSALQEDLQLKMVEVEAKKANTEALLEEMGKQRSEAEAQQRFADHERAKADDAAQNARKIEEEAAGDLAVAKPALDAACDAVNCLDKSSMTELKSFTKPPNGVDKVTMALLIMIKGERRDFSWENAKKMMAKLDAFKEKLETYRGENIPEDVVRRVDPLLQEPNFTYEGMRTKSLAAANLCNWVVNIITYNKVYKKVKPLMDSLEEAKDMKDKAESELQAVEAKMREIELELNRLQASFMEATEEKARVEAQARECENRLNLAERLTRGLASENERWGQTVDQLKDQAVTMPGDVLVAAAFVSYIGAFSAQYRDDLWKNNWLPDLTGREIPVSEGIDPLHVLTSDSIVAQWQNEGLPADRVSIENGALITNSQRWPLLIDPQLQGIKWLRAREEERMRKLGGHLHMLQFGEKNWQQRVVSAIQAGETVIFENIGEAIDATLDPVLTRAVYRKGRSLFLRIGGDDVEYDPNFRLFLQTKLANPHYKPEIAAQCALVNFIVTERGLEDQLLARVVSEEQPELEQEKNELVQAFNRYKIQLQEFEDQLLERLANAPEDILSDVPLIEGLEATKAKANEISEAVARGKETEKGINEAREVYRSVAMEASMLYFTLLQLHNLNHMYQYSLDSFTNFFLKALRSAEAAEEAEARVNNLQLRVRWVVYTWVVRGLFEQQKLLFQALLTFNLIRTGVIGEESGYSLEAMDFLLRGPRKAENESCPLDWLSSNSWAAIMALSELDEFGKLPSDMEESGSRFLEWFQHPAPETEKLPLDWRELDKKPFLKLLVVRCLRPDRLTNAVQEFILASLPDGQAYVECDAKLNSFQVLETSFEDSDPTVPIYFVLSPGVDIVSDVDKLADANGKTKGVDYHNISLGQGQDVVAQQRLQVGHREGHWVILNNVHLQPGWLYTLERILDGFNQEGSHAQFRVFLSSDPSPSIPVALLERSIKLTNDPPSGLKANLVQAFAAFSKEEHDELEPRSRGILFGLAYFHAILLERKKFGAIGYNMMYPFSSGDLVNSASVLRNYMENAPTRVPWADLRYLFGEIMYGGHIVNDIDRTMCNKYLEFFMRDELLDEMAMYPYTEAGATENFRCPQPQLAYDKVAEHINDEFQGESPLAFGLHPNAELGFRTDRSMTLFRHIMELSTSSVDTSGGAMSSQHVAEGMLQDVLELLRDTYFDLDSIVQSMDDIGPFQNVVLQECERMNTLLAEIVRSLTELDMGFRGDLTMSESMERLQEALFLDRIPATWAVLAFPSLRSLGGWLQNVQNRITQLQDWAAAPSEFPVVTWLPGLFNPQSFLTAIMQMTAQAQTLELDKLTVLTDVTKKADIAEITAPSRDGAFVYGLYLEGGRWNIQNGVLESAKPREMFCEMPVVNCKPAVVERVESNVYMCPVYKTTQRGPTYIFTARLRTKSNPSKWVLAGVALVLDVADGL